MQKVAITGANGQLGSRLIELLGTRAVPLARSECDFTMTDNIAGVMASIQPDAIINCAAYTNVEKAEDEALLALRINSEAAATMAAWAAQHAVPFIHVSTDYVFDGTKGSPYREADATHALNAYGKSKEAGEKAVLKANPHALVVRVSWLYDVRGKNFFTTIAGKLKTEPTLRVVNDQQGTPCFAPDVAAALLQLIEKPFAGGVIHMVQQGFTTWYGFAEAIRNAMKAHGVTPLADVQPIASTAYAARAERPRDSRLDATMLYTRYGLRLAAWEDAVVRAVKESER